MQKTLVITGGTGGLGTALIRRLAREDHRLAVTYLLPDEADHTALAPFVRPALHYWNWIAVGALRPTTALDGQPRSQR